MEVSKKRIENWKSLIDDLKRCGEIKSVIKDSAGKKRYDKKEMMTRIQKNRDFL